MERDEWRSATLPAHTPSRDNGWRIGGSNTESGKQRAAGAKGDIGALVCPISGRCLDDRVIGNMQGSHRCAHTAKVIAVNQIRIAILAQ